MSARGKCAGRIDTARLLADADLMALVVADGVTRETLARGCGRDLDYYQAGAAGPTPKARRNGRAPLGEPEREHVYRDADGKPVLLVRIYRRPDGSKNVPQYVPDGKGDWKPGGGEWPDGRPLYRLPELLAADRDELVYVVEGEKDAETLAAVGLVATTSCMGALKAGGTDWSPLAGRDVVILPHHDVPGFKHAEQVATLATTAGSRRLRIVPLPGYPVGHLLPVAHGKDISDWLAEEGHDLTELLVTVDSADDWEPEPVAASDTGQPPYPAEVLPELARSFVLEAARAIGVPSEMVAMPLLAAAGAAIGNQRCLELKGGWREYPVLWPVVVARPGAAKSPASRAALAPLIELQRQAKVDYDAVRATYDLEVASLEKGHPKPEKPRLEHLFTTDATVEALGDLLASSPGVVVLRDEIAGWVQGFDNYRAGGERQQHLSLWSSHVLKVDRRSRPDPLFVERPVACVSGGLQPDMLESMADEAGRDDGFLPRFLWGVPETTPARWTDDEVSATTSGRMLATMRDLRYAATGDEPLVYRLSPHAMRAWVAWYDENMERTDDASGVMAGVHAKMPNQVARLALVLHSLADPGGQAGEDSQETMEAAVLLGEYHRQHAGLALALIGDAEAGPGAAIGLRIRRFLGQTPGQWVTKSDLLRGFRVPADALDDALTLLVAGGAVEYERRASGPKGGRPSDCWRILVPEGTNYPEETSYPDGATTEVTGVSSDSSVTSDGSSGTCGDYAGDCAGVPHRDHDDMPFEPPEGYEWAKF